MSILYLVAALNCPNHDRSLMLGIASLLVLFLLSTGMQAGLSQKSIVAAHSDLPIQLDGVLSEPQWRDATPVIDFTQFDPEEGASPTESTSVRILYDDGALYVGVICYDANPEGIVRQLTRRDRGSEADRFTVQIDSYYDHQTAFVFSTNVSGVQSDGVLSQGGIVYDVSWDAVWDVATAVTREGWIAEFSIPYNALRFSERQGVVYEWGINFRRYISRKHETDEWVMVPRSETEVIPRWGRVTGIRDIRLPLHLELVPYVSGRSLFETAAPGRGSRSTVEGTGGLDVKYGLTRNFTLDVTINPDFGQVEVDQAVLNLTVFETLFPEKRPFFVEDSQLFVFGATVDNTSLPLFFPRRIGRRPTGSLSLAIPVGGTIEENPAATTILGAAKLSGRLPSGFSLGAVSATADEENAMVKMPGGNTLSIRTEPRATYNVVRVKQEFESNSWIGGLATAVGKESTLPAFSGGVDWNLRLGNGVHALDGFVAGTQSSAGVGSRGGMSGRLLLSRISSEHWFYTTAYEFFSKHFNSNDLGFFAQPHEHGGYVQLLYRENFAGGMLRRYALALNPEYRWNWAAIRTHARVNASATGEFTNFWAATATYSVDAPSYDDAERGLVGIYRRPPSHEFRLQVQSDERFMLSAVLATGYAFDAKQKTGMYISSTVKLRPASYLEFSPGVYYQRTRRFETGVLSGGQIVAVNEPGGLYSLFGSRDVDELDLAVRGIVTFTRTVSLQFYSQVLLARGGYRDFRLLIGGDRFQVPSTPQGGYDFNSVTFNANALLRWEYLPGSAAYLVWTQGRFNDIGNYARGFGARFNDAFTLPHEDVLLLKVSYFLPL